MSLRQCLPTTKHLCLQMHVLTHLGSEKTLPKWKVTRNPPLLEFLDRIDRLQHCRGNKDILWSLAGISQCFRIIVSQHNWHGSFHASHCHPYISLDQAHPQISLADSHHQLHKSLWVDSFMSNTYHYSIAQTYQIICAPDLFMKPHTWYTWSYYTCCFFDLHSHILQALPHSCIQINLPWRPTPTPYQLEAPFLCKIQLRSCGHHTEKIGWGWHQWF